MSQGEVVDPSMLEPELELLLSRWVPDMKSLWQSASVTDIAALEKIAGTELPRCYRWMLQRLGNGLSDISYDGIDFSARRIVEGYTRNEFRNYNGMICIAHDTNMECAQERYYDVTNPTEGDASVYTIGPEKDEITLEFESLRCLIAFSVFNNYRVQPMAQHCEGVFRTKNSNVFEELFPVISDLGFLSPIPKNPHVHLFDNGTIAFYSYRSPERYRMNSIPFTLGGPSTAALRSFLGIVLHSTSIELFGLEWS